MNWIGIAFLALAIWNMGVFCLYGLDKHKAKHGGRRVSEKTLLSAAALMGGSGALLGMYVFRHKTKHARFKIGVPLLLAVNIVVAVMAVNSLDMWNQSAQYQKITPETAKEMMDGGSITVLDVRTAAEYEEAHIINAVLIPDTDIKESAPKLLPDKMQTILVYCWTGIRSERAAKVLIDLGYLNVYDFGGIVDWPYQTVVG